MLPVLHNVDSGIKRLLAAPGDLPHRNPLAGKRWAWSEASAQHRMLFDQYCGELAAVVREVEEWWTAMLAMEKSRGASDPEALRGLYTRRPAGPASHPGTIRVVRKYWLACDTTNRSDSPFVAPEVFLIAWLVERRMEREIVVLTGMPYWPIGMDAEGNWV
jgi:hypothetical protein